MLKEHLPGLDFPFLCLIEGGMLLATASTASESQSDVSMTGIFGKGEMVILVA